MGQGTVCFKSLFNTLSEYCSPSSNFLIMLQYTFGLLPSLFYTHRQCFTLHTHTQKHMNAHIHTHAHAGSDWEQNLALTIVVLTGTNLPNNPPHTPKHTQKVSMTRSATHGCGCIKDNVVSAQVRQRQFISCRSTLVIGISSTHAERIS